MSDKERYCICRSTDSKSFMIACDKCEEWFHGKCIKVTPDKASQIKRYYCAECQKEDPSLRIKFKKRKEKRQRSKDEEPPAKKKRKNHKIKIYKSIKQCRDCDNCKRHVDCGVCDFCTDMKKYGGPNRIRQKCRLRQCKVLGIQLDDDKFCAKEPFQDESRAPAAPLDPPKGKKPLPPKPPATEKKKRGPKPKPKEFKPKEFKPKEFKPKEFKPKEFKPKESKPKEPKTRKPYTRKNQNENVAAKASIAGAPRQCYGPRCVNAARQGSKYCSDECGIKLGAMRLVEIMPRRIAQWQSSPCVAEQKNRKELEEIREKILEAKRHLESLDEKHRVIDKIVERGKQETVKQKDSDEESDSDDEEEEEDMDLFVYCVTCGLEIRQRNAFKHMERCFIKIEKDMSFAGTFKSMIGGDTICDHYNVSTKSYCKRLKVICAEHAKDPKVADDEICGCPLTKGLFTENNELCKNAKKHCVDHFRWERMRRAEIDADKVRQWMKIDEMFERERLIRTAMTDRAGLLSLLLHQTVDHEAMQSHHKHHTPVKPESRVQAPAKAPTPSTNASKDLSQAMASGEPAVDEVKVIAANKPTPANKPPPVSKLSPSRSIIKPAISQQPFSLVQPNNVRLQTPKPIATVVMAAGPGAGQSSPMAVAASTQLLNMARQSASNIPLTVPVSSVQQPPLGRQRSLIVNPVSVPAPPHRTITMQPVRSAAPVAPSNKMPLLQNILKKPEAAVISVKQSTLPQGTKMMITAGGMKVVQPAIAKTIVAGNKVPITIVTVRTGGQTAKKLITVPSVAVRDKQTTVQAVHQRQTVASSAVQDTIMGSESEKNALVSEHAYSSTSKHWPGL